METPERPQRKISEPLVGEDTAAIASSSSPQLLQSPVPLNAQEEGSAQVRALAEALAPTLVAADELLRVPEEFRRHNDDNNTPYESENDDMDDEVEALGMSEAVLRQEMELANDFSNLFQFEAEHSFEDSDENECELISETPMVKDSTESLQKSPNGDDNNDDDNDNQNVIDKKLKPIPLPSPPITPPKRPEPATARSLFASPKNVHYSASAHAKQLHLVRESHAWYSVSLARHFGLLQVTEEGNGGDDEKMENKEHLTMIRHSVKEYCVAVPDSKLRSLYIGFPESRSAPVIEDTTPAAEAAMTVSTSTPPDGTTTRLASSAATNLLQPLPVRTVSIRIRPDVLCGAVMEAVHHALMNLNAHITKRQGGHAQAVLRAATVSINTPTEEEEVVTPSSSSPPTSWPAFSADIHLVTNKTNDCERMLILRIYHIDDEARAQAATTPKSEDTHTASPSKEDLLAISQPQSLSEPINTKSAIHLREASALIQRIETPHAAKRIQSRGTPGSTATTVLNPSEIVSAHLLENYRACPSVCKGGITLPALNANDYAVIQSSWRLVDSVWDELFTRDLAYATMQSCSFGAFPSLPTVDVHYCSQIRRYSREVMIQQLVKTAGELETFAREGEFACANMITLLKPTFEAYNVKAPALPKPKLLTEYPLDYIVPQESCPPWGVRVQKALNEIQAWTGEANKAVVAGQMTLLPADVVKSFNLASTAVGHIFDAFQVQDDEEQSARLGRKNMQVMDRLEKMQTHERLSIQTLANCTVQCSQALKASISFNKKTGVQEVPLLKWNIVVGRATGTCTVTENHVLFTTTLIPIVGGITKHVYNIQAVDFVLTENSTSLLNPLPVQISVTQFGKEVYNFRPSMGGARLKAFLDAVKNAAEHEPLSIPSTATTNDMA